MSPRWLCAVGMSVALAACGRTSHEPAEVYATRCAACHGERGGGDGPLSSSFSPHPRSFRDGAWQRSVTDAQVHAVIAGGGAARGLSTSMPGNPDLSVAEVDALVRFLRALGPR